MEKDKIKFHFVTELLCVLLNRADSTLIMIYMKFFPEVLISLWKWISFFFSQKCFWVGAWKRPTVNKLCILLVFVFKNYYPASRDGNPRWNTKHATEKTANNKSPILNKYGWCFGEFLQLRIRTLQQKYLYIRFD